MKTALPILSYGVVSAAGNSLSALDPEAQWSKTELPRLLENHGTTSIAKVDLSSLDHWKKEPRFRRASPLSYFLVEAVSQTLTPISNRDKTGLIVILFTGSITYSRRFYQEIVQQGTRVASPMIFPETVFNSPTSHVVSQLKIGGPVYSLLGDETAWIAGLETAALWLQLGKAENVVVVAGYEIDAMSIEAYHAAGWIKKGLLPAEGAGAILLGQPAESTRPQIVELEQGYLYRTRQEFRKQKQMIENEFKQNELLPPPWNPWTAQKNSPPTHHGFPLSAAWKTIEAARSLSHQRKILPLYGCNHQAGIIGLR